MRNLLELLPPKLELDSILSEMLDPVTKLNIRLLITPMLKPNTKPLKPKLYLRLRAILILLLHQPPPRLPGPEDKPLRTSKNPTRTRIAKMLPNPRKRVRLKTLLRLYLLKKRLNFIFSFLRLQ